MESIEPKTTQIRQSGYFVTTKPSVVVVSPSFHGTLAVATNIQASDTDDIYEWHVLYTAASSLAVIATASDLNLRIEFVQLLLLHFSAMHCHIKA